MIYDLLLTQKIVMPIYVIYVLVTFFWFDRMLLSVINNYISNHKSENFAIHETVSDVYKYKDSTQRKIIRKQRKI